MSAILTRRREEHDPPRLSALRWQWGTPVPPFHPILGKPRDYEPFLPVDTKLNVRYERNPGKSVTVRLEHSAIPIEWADDLAAWWSYQLASCGAPQNDGPVVCADTPAIRAAAPQPRLRRPPMRCSSLRPVHHCIRRLVDEDRRRAGYADGRRLQEAGCARVHQLGLSCPEIDLVRSSRPETVVVPSSGCENSFPGSSRNGTSCGRLSASRTVASCDRAVTVAGSPTRCAASRRSATRPPPRPQRRARRPAAARSAYPRAPWCPLRRGAALSCRPGRPRRR